MCERDLIGEIMKKIIKTALPLMLLSTTTFSMTEGFYVGAGLGVVDQISKFSVTDNTIGNYSTFSIDQGNTGFSGVIEGGYTYLFNDFAIGFQADAQFSNNSVGFSFYNADVFGNYAANASLDNKNSYGLNVRPAYIFNDCVSTFLVLGYRRGNFDFTVSNVATGFPVVSYSTNSNSDGIEVGIGTEIAINDQFGMRLEVTQTAYQTDSVLSNLNLGSAEFKNKVNQGLLSLVWYPSIG